MTKVELIHKLARLNWALDDALEQLYDHDGPTGELVDTLNDAIGKVAVVIWKLQQN